MYDKKNLVVVPGPLGFLETNEKREIIHVPDTTADVASISLCFKHVFNLEQGGLKLYEIEGEFKIGCSILFGMGGPKSLSIWGIAIMEEVGRGSVWCGKTCSG